MSSTEKKLAPGQARFIPKQQGLATSSPWRVYDVARGSWPGTLAMLGTVNQAHRDEASARVEADRLNRIVEAHG